MPAGVYPHCTGEGAAHWKGGTTRNDGYINRMAPDHPRANRDGYVKDHILIVERVLGRYLARENCIHHVNEVRDDNRNANFVVCQDNAYHRLIHVRMRALRESGDVHRRKCRLCGKWDEPTNLKLNHSSFYHARCHADYQKARHRARKTV